MSDSFDIFFEEDDDAVSISCCSSVDTNAVPSAGDLSSDYSSMHFISCALPSSPPDILDLFEEFTGVSAHPNDDDETPGQLQNSSRQASAEVQPAASPLAAVYEQYRALDQSPWNIECASTFCLEESMVTPFDDLPTGGTAPNTEFRAATRSSQDLAVDASVETECIEGSEMIDVFHSGNNNVPFETKHATNVNGNQHIETIPTKTLEECNDAQLTASQLTDCLQDSEFQEFEGNAGVCSQSNEKSPRHSQIQARIVEVLQQIEQTLSEGVPLTVRRKPTWQSCSMENGMLQSNSSLPQAARSIKLLYCRRLQLMVRLLASIYQLLVTGTSCTKRELYYLHLELSQSPAYAYAVLDDVCALLDVDAWEVNVFNTSKGLIAGALLITLACGRTVDCNVRWGTCVPLDVGSVVELQVNAELVLVVEKDTVFKRLLEDGIMDKFSNRVLLVTGKGYPDISTRLLLKKIADKSDVPICGLMDADPHGIEILCVYKFGSLKMAHQQQSLAVPTMHWIGLFPSDIELFGLQGVPLRESEVKKIEHIIKRPYTEGIIQRELLFLRQLATKAEIESLYEIASDFVTTVYLTQKLKKLRIY